MRILHRPLVVLSALTCAALLRPDAIAPASTAAPGPTSPNILVIMVDDVGADQLACYDSAPGVAGLDPGSNLYSAPYPYAATPNLTALARDGVRFTRAFSSPVCSPSRAQLMTGRYPFRTKIGGIVTPHGKSNQPPFSRGEPQLPNSEYTLPEVLALFSPTYELGLFGKWHLTGDKCEVPPTIRADVDGDDHPAKAGWPEYEGIIRNILGRPNPDSEGCIVGRASYYDWFHVQNELNPPPYTPCPGSPPDACIPPSTCTLREYEQQYITTKERQRVEDFTLNAPEPWCAVWSPQACHGPFDWPPEELHSFGNEPFDLLDAQIWIRFLAVLEAFDTEIGNLRAALDEGSGETVWDRTLVLFVGDNGNDAGAVYDASQRIPGILDPYVAPDFVNGKATRYKGNAYFSGTNIPLIASGAGISNPGRTCGELVDVVDVFETVRDLAGVPGGWTSMMGLDGRTIDGLSLRPVLEETGNVGRVQSLALHYSPNGEFDLDNLPENWQVGFATQLANGELYHLVQRDDRADEFYQLCDSNGDDVDTAEANPLPLTHPEYQESIDALRTLIQSP